MQSPRKNPNKVELTDTQRRWAKAFIAQLGGTTNMDLEFAQPTPSISKDEKSQPELMGRLGEQFGVDQALNDLNGGGLDEQIPLLSKFGFNNKVQKPVNKFLKEADELLRAGKPITEDVVSPIMGQLVNAKRGEDDVNVLAAIDRRMKALERLITATTMKKEDRLKEIQKMELKEQAKILAQNPALLNAVIVAAPPNLHDLLLLLPKGDGVWTSASEQFVASNLDHEEYVSETIVSLIGSAKGNQETGTFLRGESLAIHMLKSFSLSKGGQQFCDGYTQEALLLIKLSRKSDQPPKEGDKYKNEGEAELAPAIAKIVYAILDKFLSTPPDSMPKPLLICSSILVDGIIQAGETSLSNIAGMVGGHFLLRLVTPLIATLGEANNQKKHGLSDDQAKIATRAAGVLMLINKGTLPPGSAYTELAMFIPLLEKHYLAMAQAGRKARGLEELNYRNFVSGGGKEVDIDWEDPGSTKGRRTGEGIPENEGNFFEDENATIDEDLKDQLVIEERIEEPPQRQRSRNTRFDGNTPKPNFTQLKKTATGIEGEVDMLEDLEDSDPLDDKKGEKKKQTRRRDSNNENN